MNELVSIIIPVYNAEKTLRRCVDSCLRQTYPSIEVLLVNDGSKDNSYTIMQEYENKDSRVRIFNNINHGVSYTRNYGIKNANGKLVHFVDSDDYISDKMIELLYKKIEDGADLAVSGKWIIRKNKQTENGFDDCSYMGLTELRDDFCKLYSTSFFHSPIARLYKKELITEYFDETISYGEDLLFNLAYLRNCNKLSTISESCYFYDTAESTLTMRYHKNEQSVIEKILNETLTFYGEYIDPDMSVKENIRKIYRFARGNYLFLFEKCIKNNSKEYMEIINSQLCQDVFRKSEFTTYVDKMVMNRKLLSLTIFLKLKLFMKKILTS